MEAKIVEIMWNAARSIPRETPNAIKLACHYLSKCKQFAGKNNIGIRCKLFGTNPMCQHCCTLWTDGKYTLRILPKKATQKRMKKILNKNSSSPELLTSYERKLLANYEKKNHNKMGGCIVGCASEWSDIPRALHYLSDKELACSVCHKRTVILMKKPDRNIKIDNDSDLQEDRKKKKKPKDPFAGLKHSAVLAVNNTVVKTKVKKGTAVVKKNVKLPQKTLVTSNQKKLQVEILPKEFRRKDTLQRILGSSQSGVQNSTSKLQNFLAGLK